MGEVIGGEEIEKSQKSRGSSRDPREENQEATKIPSSKEAWWGVG